MKIAAGIGVAGIASGALAALTGGLARLLLAWTAAACAVACAAYVVNQPSWLGKRNGRMSPRALGLLPYLIALQIACALMRWWRETEAPSRVAPGLWVGGRLREDALLPGITFVVDLVAEYPALPGIRRLPGYRSLPVLDGGVPPDAGAFLALVRELVAADAGVLVHCDSGRGRAPTMAAALLIARGLATDIDTAVTWVGTYRPVAAPTGSDVRFLATVLPALRALAATSPGATKGVWPHAERG